MRPSYLYNKDSFSQWQVSQTITNWHDNDFIDDDFNSRL